MSQPMKIIKDIRTISRYSQYSLVNVLAQVESVGEIENYPSGAKRRYVKLVDQYNSTINLVLWDRNTLDVDENREGQMLFAQQALVNYYEQEVELKLGRKTTIKFPRI